MFTEPLRLAAKLGAYEYCEYLGWHWQTICGRVVPGHSQVGKLARLFLLLAIPFGPAAGLGCGLGRFIYTLIKLSK